MLHQIDRLTPKITRVVIQCICTGRSARPQVLTGGWGKVMLLCRLGCLGEGDEGVAAYSHQKSSKLQTYNPAPTVLTSVSKGSVKRVLSTNASPDLVDYSRVSRHPTLQLHHQSCSFSNGLDPCTTEGSLPCLVKPSGFGR